MEWDLVVPDLDIALFRVLEGSDYESQLLAIRGLLRRHKEADLSLEKEIKEIEELASKTTGMVNQHVTDEWVDHLHASVYQDAAHSMAAVGMLAPLIESLLYRTFKGIQTLLRTVGKPLSSHPRWQLPAQLAWDCHFSCTKNGRSQKGIVGGVFQLADAVRLMPHLPADLRQTLEALFEYRNKMFHNGFEWPDDEKNRFSDRIKHWPADWFAMATHDGKPWVFYMTDDFVTHCLSTIDTVLCGIGAFARDK